MSTFVIVHGGWGGGWEWTRVAQDLRERGHEVFTPTLTGLGERAHLGSDVGLSDHIDDVEALIKFEQLHDVILCGHSYSGMVVTGVAERVPDRVRLLAYLDAFVPGDGQALTDLVPDEFRDALMEAAQEQRDGTVPMPPDVYPPEGWLPEETRSSYIERVRPHPLGTMTEPVRVTGAAERVPRAFVHCTGDPESLMVSFAEKARAEGWIYREIGTPHDLQLFDPEGTSAVLEDVAIAGASTRGR